MSSSIRLPSASKRSGASATGSSVSITRAPMVCRILRASPCAQTAPNMPVEAPTTSAGTPRSGLVACGREAQSRAFLRTPGSEALYSGVAISTASASAIASRSAWTASGAGSMSSSASYGGMALRPSNTSSSAPDGSRSAAARRRFELCESRRNDPEMPRTRIELRLDELELDLELDLVGQRESALGQRRVPVEAELRAVDRGVEGEAELRVAHEVLGRAGDGARAGDPLRVALDRQVALDGRAVAVDRELERVERELRVLLRVEELGRLQVRREVLVLDLDGVGADLAVEHGVAGLVDAQDALELLERATEARNEVLDGEVGGAVDGHAVVGARRNRGGAGIDGAHGGVSLPVALRTAVRFLLNAE